jgi:hypothetical protein
MIEGLEEALALIQHERNKLNMIMIGEEWDGHDEGYAAGLDRSEELIENMIKNLRAEDASQS